MVLPARLLVGALVLSLCAPPALPVSVPQRHDLGERIAELLERRDAADPGLVERIAASGEPEALDGLLVAYDQCQTLFLRRVILRALPRFDDDGELGARAADRLAEVAAASRAPLLREEALDGLEQCPVHGTDRLKVLVETALDDAVREGAMERLARTPDAGERLWYLQQYSAAPADPRGRQRNPELEMPAPPVLPRVRQLAFGVVRSGLAEADLAQACQDRDREIRADALLELEARGSELAVPIAREVLKAQTDHFQNRAAAAGVLWRALGREMVDDFFDMGSDNITPLALRYTLADYLAQALEPSLERRLVRLVKRGRDHEKLFALRSVRFGSSEKVADAIADAIEDESPVVSFYALELIAERRDRSAMEAVRGCIEDEDDDALVASAVRALIALVDDPGQARAELVELAGHEAPSVRGAALSGLARLEGREVQDRLIAALDDDHWSVRLAALRALEDLRTPESIPAVVERLPAEVGRMRTEMTEFLWRLTGQPFGDSVASWTRWAEGVEGDVDVLPASAVARLARERFERRLKQPTFTRGAVLVENPEEASAFFGVAIDSNRVLFIVDTSGSMERTLRDEYLGDRGLQRFDVAVAELRRCLRYLDRDAYFDIFAFSGTLRPWRERLVRRDEESLQSALEFVEDLRMGGGTDIWRALEAALDIDALDTIYILSDGEPEGGRIEDPIHIRLAFGRVNAHRGVVVHAIALGGDLPLLRWLAEDSGGTYTRYR